VQRCALSLSGEESCPLLEYPLNLLCLACNKNRKKRHTKRRKEKGEKKREKRKGRKEKGEKKREKRKGRKEKALPIKNAWGQIANTKCMGTDCQ